MTVAELKAKIKSGDLSGAYIFSGEEDYLKRYYTEQLAGAVCTDEVFAPFNRVVFDGADVSVLDIKEALASPPMMADYKLVEWKYPDLEHMREGERRELCALAQGIGEYPYAVLVLLCDTEGFDPGTVRRPSRLAVSLGKNFSVVNFEKSTDAQLIAWLKKHFDAEGIGVDSGTLSALIFRSGHSMQVLKRETEKLAAYAKANGMARIDTETVRFVAAPTLECDAFALSGAITDKSREGAFLALADMKQRRVEAGAVLAMLQRSFSELATVALLLDEGKRASDIEAMLKWNPYKVKLAIGSAKRWGTGRLIEAKERLRVLDAESKSGGISGYKTLEMFICQYI